MKLMVILLLLSMVTQAQTGEEWTQQQRLKIRRLQEQIYASKVYIETARKGYAIVTGGLQTIQDIKDGEFQLHLNFFDSLTIVNPHIKGIRKVADIITGALRIIRKCKQGTEAVRASGQFTVAELDYCSRMVDNLLIETLNTIEALYQVINTGELSMSDGERIQHIDQLYANMQEQEGFMISFGNELSLLAVQRLTEQTEIDYSKKIK